MAGSDEIDETLPEVVKGFLRRGATLERIRLHADGRWTHEGLDFENRRVIDLFSRSVGRTEGGTWVLEIGPYTYPIEVEDTGFFVERFRINGGPARIEISDGSEEVLDPRTMSYGGEGRLYCQVHGGKFRARFKRPAYYAIAEHIEQRSDGAWVLAVDDVRYEIGTSLEAD